MSKLINITNENDRQIVLDKLSDTFGKDIELVNFKTMELPSILEYDEEKLWTFDESTSNKELNNIDTFVSWLFV